MKLRIAILFAAILSLYSTILAQDGDLQVTCEPGVSIWIDDVFKGVTSSRDNGIFVEGLTVGNHHIRAFKPGFEILLRPVVIERGRTLEVKLTFATPTLGSKRLSAEDSTKLTRLIGSLILRSVPLKAEVYIDNRRVGLTDLEQQVVPGKHQINFRFKRAELGGIYYVGAGSRVKLKAHFKEMKIIEDDISTSNGSQGNVNLYEIQAFTDAIRRLKSAVSYKMLAFDLPAGFILGDASVRDNGKYYRLECINKSGSEVRQALIIGTASPLSDAEQKNFETISFRTESALFSYGSNIFQLRWKDSQTGVWYVFMSVGLSQSEFFRFAESISER